LVGNWNWVLRMVNRLCGMGWFLAAMPWLSVHDDGYRVVLVMDWWPN
jgi:hypothetical protein